MKINVRTLAFFAVCLVVIAGALFILNQDNGGGSTGTAVPTSAAQRIFPDLQFPQVTRLTVRDETALTEISFDKNVEGVWKISTSTNPVTGDLSQTPIDDAVSAIALASAESFTVTADKLAQFGLEQPLYTVTLTLDNGQTQIVKLGKQTPRGDRYYALLNDNRETIYILAGAPRISTALGYAALPPLVATATPTLAPTLNLPGFVFAGYDAVQINRFEARDGGSGVLVLQRSADATLWSIVEASNKQNLPLNGDIVNAAVAGFGYVQGNTVVENADLTALGITTPSYTFSAFSGTTGSFVLRVGKEDVSGKFYYVQVNDITNQIALVPKEALDPFIALIIEPPYALPEATAEATGEATAEATSEATAETSGQAVESTAEATSEATALPTTLPATSVPATTAPTTVPATTVPTTVKPSATPTTVPATVVPTTGSASATPTTVQPRPSSTPRRAPTTVSVTATPVAPRPSSTPRRAPSSTPTTVSPTATSTPRP